MAAKTRGPRSSQGPFLLPARGLLLRSMSDDPAASFRATVRQRGHALAVLECSVDPQAIAAMQALRMGAERRAGEVMLDLFRQGDTASVRRLLVENGISRDLAGRWQNLATLDPEAFERKVVKRAGLAIAGKTNDAPARAQVVEWRRSGSMSSVHRSSAGSSSAGHSPSPA
jgi:hypothetical protein